MYGSRNRKQGEQAEFQPFALDSRGGRPEGGKAPGASSCVHSARPPYEGTLGEDFACPDEDRQAPPHSGLTPGILQACPQPPLIPRLPSSTPTLISMIAIRKTMIPITISVMAGCLCRDVPPSTSCA